MIWVARAGLAPIPRAPPKERGPPVSQATHDGTGDAPTSPTMHRSLLAPSLFFFFFAAACVTEASSSKPLAVCQEGDDGCPSVPRAEKKPPGERATGPSGDPSTPTS